MLWQWNCGLTTREFLFLQGHGQAPKNTIRGISVSLDHKKLRVFRAGLLRGAGFMWNSIHPTGSGEVGRLPDGGEATTPAAEIFTFHRIMRDADALSQKTGS